MTIRRFLFLAILAVILGACEVRTHLIIDAADLSDGTVTAVVGFDEEMRNLMEESGGQGDVLAELESAAEEEGWEAEAFVDGNIEGYQITHEFSSIEELQELMSSSMLSEDWGYTDLSFTEEGGDFVFEASGGNPMEDFSGEEGFEEMAEFLTIDFELAVTFPGNVEDHNGVLEDRTVTWDLDDLETGPGDLFGRSSIGSGFPWAILGGILLALVIAGAVVWRLRESKPRSSVILAAPVPADVETPVGPPVDPLVVADDRPAGEST